MKTTFSSLAALVLAATAHGREFHLNECPAAVQTAIEANARGGVIDEVDLISIEGKEIYIAEIDLPRDLDLKVYVSGNGSLLKTREDVSLASRPAFIRNATREHGGTIDDVEKEIAGGKVTWHVEIERKGMPDVNLVLNAEGGVISESLDHDD